KSLLSSAASIAPSTTTIVASTANAIRRAVCTRAGRSVRAPTAAVTAPPTDSTSPSISPYVPRKAIGSASGLELGAVRRLLARRGRSVVAAVLDEQRVGVEPAVAADRALQHHALPGLEQLRDRPAVGDLDRVGAVGDGERQRVGRVPDAARHHVAAEPDPLADLGLVLADDVARGEVVDEAAGEAAHGHPGQRADHDDEPDQQLHPRAVPPPARLGDLVGGDDVLAHASAPPAPGHWPAHSGTYPPAPPHPPGHPRRRGRGPAPGLSPAGAGPLAGSRCDVPAGPPQPDGEPPP